MKSLIWLVMELIQSTLIWTAFFMLGRIASRAGRSDERARKWVAFVWGGLIVNFLLELPLNGMRHFTAAWTPDAWAFDVVMLYLLLFVAACVALSIRVGIVSRFSMKVLDDSIWTAPKEAEARGTFAPYDQLPDFDDMIWSFKRMKSFLPEGCQQLDFCLPPDIAAAVNKGKVYLNVRGTRSIYLGYTPIEENPVEHREYTMKAANISPITQPAKVKPPIVCGRCAWDARKAAGRTVDEAKRPRLHSRKCEKREPEKA